MNDKTKVRTRGKLDTPGDCRYEMAKVYREARRGEIEPPDAERFVRMLTAIVSVIREDGLAHRLEALEAIAKERQS